MCGIILVHIWGGGMLPQVVSEAILVHLKQFLNTVYILVCCNWACVLPASKGSNWVTREGGSPKKETLLSAGVDGHS